MIDLPWLLQKLLVNGIIIPFRLSKSTKLYKQLWTKEGSPLMLYLNQLVEKLNDTIGNEYSVYGAMRYGSPSLKDVMKSIEAENYQELVVLPLYPQYATSTTLTTHKKVFDIVSKWKTVPALKSISQFYREPAFIKAFAAQINSYDVSTYDHVVFSYHGLPNRQIEKVHDCLKHDECNCGTAAFERSSYCYAFACNHSTLLLAHELGLDIKKYSHTYQSRLTKNWLSPFTDEVLIALAKKGAKRVLVVAPAFVADCLETIVEIGIEYKELFIENGGEALQLVESLNANDQWVNAIGEIIKK